MIQNTIPLKRFFAPLITVTVGTFRVFLIAPYIPGDALSSIFDVPPEYFLYQFDKFSKLLLISVKLNY